MSIFLKWFSEKEKEGTSSTKPQRLQNSAADYCEQSQKMLNDGKLMQAIEYFQAAI